MTMPINYAALPTIQFESFIKTIFKPVKIAYESGSKKVANMLLMEMIHTLKIQNNEIIKLREEMYKNKHIAVPLDTEEFYEIMGDVEDILERLLDETKEYKDKSEIFTELYIIVDDLYTNTLQMTYQVSQMVIELKFENEGQKVAS